MSIEVVGVVATPSFCIHRMSTAAAENVWGKKEEENEAVTCQKENFSTNYIIQTFIAYGRRGISLCLCGITRKGISQAAARQQFYIFPLLFSVFISVMGLHSESILYMHKSTIVNIYVKVYTM